MEDQELQEKEVMLVLQDLQALEENQEPVEDQELMDQ